MAYVYRFVDSNNKIIYIGKTKRDINERMNEHFSNKGHLSSECYKSVAKIEYMTVKTDADALLVEVYLINKYRPRYNRQNKSNDVGQTIKLDIDEKKWKVYKQFKNMKSSEELGPFKSLLFSLAYISLIVYIFLYFIKIFF